MKLTKYEHACLVIERADAALVIDPGSFTMPLTDLMDVVAVVITHEHGDHWTADQLTRIKERNPKVRFFGPTGVVAAATDFAIEAVADGDTVNVGEFELRFFGETHAVIHESIPVVDNVGVLVNDTFYYGGDSYTVPGVSVPVLAAPVGAPWLKIGEAMDYVMAVKPRRAFAVHEATLSQIGRKMAGERLGNVTRLGGGEWIDIETGDTVEL